MTWRVSRECWSGVWIGGCGVGRGLKLPLEEVEVLELPLEEVLGEVLGWKGNVGDC